MRKIFYIYFDLRKYSFIDRRYKSEDQFLLLSEMHQIIEADLENKKGDLYYLAIDTALYIVLPHLDTKNTLQKMECLVGPPGLELEQCPYAVHIFPYRTA